MRQSSGSATPTFTSECSSILRPTGYPSNERRSACALVYPFTTMCSTFVHAIFPIFIKSVCLPPLYYRSTQEDPYLELHQRELIMTAATQLDKARMIRYHEPTGTLHSTDLGRTASHFYIKHVTIEVKYLYLKRPVCMYFPSSQVQASLPFACM